MIEAYKDAVDLFEKWKTDAQRRMIEAPAHDWVDYQSRCAAYRQLNECQRALKIILLGEDPEAEPKEDSFIEESY